MPDAFKLLDVVTLVTDLPAHDLVHGAVGTVVEHPSADVFEVEFSDDRGRTRALVALRADQLLWLQRVESRAELLELLRTNTASVLLGEGEESWREYYLLTLPNCRIGVCSDPGSRLSAMMDESDRAIWIGYSLFLARVDLTACRQQFALRLEGSFYETLPLMPDHSVIIIHELGVCRVSRSGDLVWHYSASDVVTDFGDEGDLVRLRTWDEREVRIDKRLGGVFDLPDPQCQPPAV